jgi:hypothetical protein
MWVRKSPETLAAEREQRANAPRLLRALLISAAITTGIAILYALGVRGYSRGVVYLTSAESSQEALAHRPWILLPIFAVILGITYRSLKSPATLAGPTTALLCTRCFEAHTPDKSHCPCGGELEPLGLWEWMEDEEHASEARAK